MLRRVYRNVKLLNKSKLSTTNIRKYNKETEDEIRRSKGHYTKEELNLYADLLEKQEKEAPKDRSYFYAWVACCTIMGILQYEFGSDDSGTKQLFDGIKDFIKPNKEKE
eukprot:gene7500-11823_t